MPTPRPEAALALVKARSLLPTGWLADGIRNLTLFAPVGAALVASGRTSWAAIATGFALSLAIELIQLAIPGRFASPLDLASNTLGTALGAGLARVRGGLIRPSPEVATRLSLTACAVSALLLLAAVWLLQPAFPRGTYFGGWTLDLGHLALYQGRVLEARVGTIPIVAFGPASDSDALRRELARAAHIFVSAVAGPPPTGVAPLVTIHDERQREILLVGIDGVDLVVRRHLRAAALGLENPSIRLSGALTGVSLDEPFAVHIIADGSARWFVALGDNASRIPLGWTPGRSWALLVPTVSVAAAHTLDVCWIALLVFPASFWARRQPVCWLGLAALVVTLAVVPQLGTIAASPPREWIAAVAGVVAGLWCSRRVSDRSRTGKPGAVQH